MVKIAFIFPGQGAQYSGMGYELYRNYECARKIYDEADEVLGFGISRLCFEGTREELARTDVTQPAVLVTSIACFEVVKHHGIHADAAAGLSLGEYSALIASGALSFSDGVSLVRKRGQYMHDAVKGGSWGMAAVIGMAGEEIKYLCREAETVGFADISNLNCPGQIVVAGDMKAIDFIMQKVKGMGKRCIPLNVEGPFHTKVLEPAAKQLKSALDEVHFNEMSIPVVTNVTGGYIKDISEIAGILVKQVESCVKWESCIRRLIEDGVDTFIELGPGKALSGFVRKTDKNVSVYNVEDIKSLQNTINSIGGKLC